MPPALKQVEMGGLDDEREEQLESEAGLVWRAQLWSAMRSFVDGYVDVGTGLKKAEGCAYRLNRRWEPEGRPVTPAALTAALRDSERNNFRLEWADWFAARSPEVAELLGRRVKPEKTDRQMYDDLCAEIREEYPKQADKIIRRARAR